VLGQNKAALLRSTAVFCWRSEALSAILTSAIEEKSDHANILCTKDKSEKNHPY
jgi:hypothetical protein